MIQTDINIFSYGIQDQMGETELRIVLISNIIITIIVLIGLAFASYKYFWSKSENSKKEALIIIISTVVACSIIYLIFSWIKNNLIF